MSVSNLLYQYVGLSKAFGVKLGHSLIGVANGASKTLGLAKLSPKFTGLAVSFFSGYACLAVSIFFTSLSRRINFFKAKNAAKYRFVYILYMNLNNVGTSQARTFIKNTLRFRSRI